MISKKIFLIPFSFFFACSQNINEADLTFKNENWYTNDQLFSGNVYRIVRNEKINVGKIENGIKEGLWIEFGSMIWRKGLYINGMKTDLWEGFFIDSIKAFSGTYIKDLKEGLWQGWTKKGGISYKGNYLNDKKEGVWVYYYDNEQKSDSGSYKNNLMVGLWKYWYPNGNLLKTGKYNPLNGNESGVWIIYRSDGNFLEKKDYGNF